MKKRAQFYLLAAIIIVAIVIGIATVTNVVISRQTPGEVKVYQLSQELKLEGEKVINFGIYNAGVNLDAALIDFTQKYGNYVADKDNDIYLIYGNKEKVSVIGYVNVDLGSISLDFGGSEPINFNIIGRTTPIEEVNLVEDETNVIVEVAGTKYPFEIKEGQNFFFVIQQSAGGTID